MLSLLFHERLSTTLPSSSFFHFWTSGFVFESSIFFVFKVFFYRSRIILARPMTTLYAKLRKEKTVETVRAIVGPVSLFVGTEPASTLRIARFADNTAGTLHRKDMLASLNSANSSNCLCAIFYTPTGVPSPVCSR